MRRLVEKNIGETEMIYVAALELAGAVMIVAAVIVAIVKDRRTKQNEWRNNRAFHERSGDRTDGPANDHGREREADR